MKKLTKYNEFDIYLLEKEVCKKYSYEILSLLKNIPFTNYKLEDFINDTKRNKILYGKWEYSLVAFKKEKLVGILIGYEKEKDYKEYPKNCFYINEISISSDVQGKWLGKFLLNYFIKKTEIFHYLEGNPIIRIQTTNKKENEKVISLYKKIGFKEVGIKKYPLKDDLILELKKPSIF